MTRIIKKYANRRLYDTKSSVYITLDDLKELVLNQVDFCVIDAKTKKDITKSTLFQIISTHEENITPIFTTEILQHLIRSYSNNMQEILGHYLEQAINFFIHHQMLPNTQGEKLQMSPLTWMDGLFKAQQRFWDSFNQSLGIKSTTYPKASSKILAKKTKKK